MLINVILTQPLTPRDQTVTLSAGPLVLNTKILIPSDADASGQECLSVCGVLSKTQAKVIRGANSTIARSWPTGTPVSLSSDGLMYEPRIEQTDEQEPSLARPPRRQVIDIADTVKRGACPTCGREN